MLSRIGAHTRNLAQGGTDRHIFSKSVETMTEWQGIIDVIGTHYYVEIVQMKPVLQIL